MINGFFSFSMQSASRNCHHHRILQLLAIKLKRSVSISGCIDSFSIKNDWNCMCELHVKIIYVTILFCWSSCIVSDLPSKRDVRWISRIFRWIHRDVRCNSAAVSLVKIYLFRHPLAKMSFVLLSFSFSFATYVFLSIYRKISTIK